MITVKNISKSFKLYKKPSDRLKEIFLNIHSHKLYHALKDVSFEVKDSETLGIIGQNGAGKSTLLKILMGIIIPDTGIIEKSGRITGLLELGTGFNFEMTGIQNIYMNGSLLGMTHDEIGKKFNEIIDFSELGAFIEEPIKTYSSGMLMRLAFSIAIHADPQCFLVDEALSVGDAHFQQKSIKKIKEFKEKGGSIIFVSHDMNAVKVLCDSAMLLEKGGIMEYGSPEYVVNRYNWLIARVGNDESIKPFQELEDKKGYGTLESCITDIKLIGSESGTDVVSSGEHVDIDIIIETQKKIDDFTVGFLIKDRYGQHIYGNNSFYLNKNVFIDMAGNYKANFNFFMNIAPGKYTLTVALHNQETHLERCYHWIDNALEFEVHGNKTEIFEGICNLKADFNFMKVK